MKPKISIIVAAYNEEKFLPTCLESLKKQNYPKDQFEIIVVDNGSKDSTFQVAKKFTDKVFLYKDLQGCGAARTFGVKQSSGNIIAFTDADTVLPENWLSKIEKYLDDSSVMAVGGKLLPSQKSLWFSFVFNFYDFSFFINNFFHIPLVWGPNMAFKKSAYELVGGIDYTLSSSDDWDLALRVQKHFGKKSVSYKSDLLAYTAIRKFDNAKLFLRYIIDGSYNYINMVILKRRKVKPVFNIR